MGGVCNRRHSLYTQHCGLFHFSLVDSAFHVDRTLTVTNLFWSPDCPYSDTFSTLLPIIFLKQVCHASILYLKPSKTVGHTVCPISRTHTTIHDLTYHQTRSLPFFVTYPSFKPRQTTCCSQEIPNKLKENPHVHPTLKELVQVFYILCLLLLPAPIQEE